MPTDYAPTQPLEYKEFEYWKWPYSGNWYNKTRIYIAGPYTADTEEETIANVNRAIDAANKLLDLGYDIFVPHLCHYLHERSPKPYEYWIAYCLRELSRCDAVFVVAHSPGVNREILEAAKLGIPIYYSLEELCK